MSETVTVNPANDEIDASTIDAKRIAVEGSMLGTAVGDALGLPYENMSPRRIRKLCGRPTSYRFLFGYGMVSDDTEHTCLVAQSLMTCREDPSAFEQDLARRLKWWLARLPAATGKATAQSLIKLWLGFSTDNSGVFSAGNGPTMRAPIIGAAINDEQEMVDFVSRSARITHSDPKATYGAITVALATQMSGSQQTNDTAEFLSRLDALLPTDEPATELRSLLNDVARSIQAGESTQTYALRTFGKAGVSGYTYQTVPAAIHCWLSHQDDFREAVVTMVECGGDTDSTAAIVGGIIGARVGRNGIPEEYLKNLCEWPCTLAWMSRVAAAVATDSHDSWVSRLPALRQLARNLAFLVVVLAHAARRLAPPY